MCWRRKRRMCYRYEIAGLHCVSQWYVSLSPAFAGLTLYSCGQTYCLENSNGIMTKLTPSPLLCIKGSRRLLFQFKINSDCGRVGGAIPWEFSTYLYKGMHTLLHSSYHISGVKSTSVWENRPQEDNETEPGRLLNENKLVFNKTPAVGNFKIGQRSLKLFMSLALSWVI